MSHTAEIIAVGTEILLGNIANTDAQMLSQSLSTLGVNVFWHTVVGDNPQRLREALDIARHRADIILTTGGLGPTYDDLTKQTICAAFGQKLVLHEDILEDIRAFYQSVLHVPMPENNTQQAELLQSFQTNLTRISLLIGVLVVALSALLSRAFTRKIRELLQAIRQVREGAYSHRASVRGNDEIAQLATEFNSLTDRLQTTEAARRRFVSDASHELKTPLAGIRLLTDSILQTEDMNADTTREFVEDIGREAQRLSRITEDLLRLTRLDSGIQDAAYPVSVSRVLERVVRMLGVVAREKEVTLTYETDEDAVVRATEDDIHQILYNLMENGIKYSGSMGFVHTTLKTVGDTVVISVEDNGVGIPNEDMEHIFERFYRVDKNRSRAVGGTGLGLSIVSDTVRRRGGSIRAQHRQSGSGTVFIVELPLARREEADE